MKKLRKTPTSKNHLSAADLQAVRAKALTGSLTGSPAMSQLQAVAANPVMVGRLSAPPAGAPWWAGLPHYARKQASSTT